MNLKLNVKKEGLALSPNELINNEEFELNFGHVFRGERGVDGKSAYDSAVEGGYEGTEQEFNIGLKDLNNKPNKEGYYPAMSVGMADELVGRGDVQDAYINFRPSGGVNKNIKDGAARVKAIKGNSVVWNNIASPLSDITQRPNWSLEYEGGILYGTVTTAAPSYSISVQISAHNTIPNHTYLVYVKTSNSEGVESLNMYFGGEYPAIAANGATIVTATSADKMYIYPFSSMGNSIGVGASFTIEELQIVDLTLMCSAGNEPKSYEEYLERKPMNIADEFAYNTGTLVDMKVNSLISTSDNAYDYTKGYARVMGGMPYTFTVDNRNDITPEEVYFSETLPVTTFEENIIYPNADGTYTFPSNGYAKASFQGYEVGKEDTICICLKHSYDKPHPAHQPDVKDLSFISEAFPEGMRSAGSAFDEIRFNPTKKKWEGVKRVESRAFAEGDAEDTTVKTDGATTNYPLAKPVVVELDYPTEETNMDYRVWDFGTEEAITSEPSAPFRAGIEYGFNATDDIRSLLERVAQLEARLTQLTNE
jgi:hypothetical protein